MNFPWKVRNVWFASLKNNIMKKTNYFYSLLFLIVGISFNARSQNNDGLIWSNSNGLPPSPHIGSGPVDVQIINRKLYEFKVKNSAYQFYVSSYDPVTGTWQSLDTIGVGYPSAIKTLLINNKVYIVTQGSSSFSFYEFNLVTNQLSTLTTIPVTNCLLNNWKIEKSNSGQIFFASIETSLQQINFLEYDIVGNTWTNNPVTVSSTIDISDELELYIANTSGTIYLGNSGFTDQIYKKPLSGGTFTPYDGVSGFIKYDGNVDSDFSKKFYFVGDGNADPVAHCQDSVIQKTYSISANSPININSAGTVTVPFNTSFSQDHFLLSNPNYTFLVSNFTEIDLANNSNKFYVYRKDNTTGTPWDFPIDSLGPKVLLGVNSIDKNSLRLSLSFPDTKLLTITYSVGGIHEYKVLSAIPTAVAPTNSANTGMCVGSAITLLDELKIESGTGDVVRINTIDPSQSINQINSFTYSSLGTELLNGVMISKFEVSGFSVSSITTSTFIPYTFTNGWNEFGAQIQDVLINTPTPNVTFTGIQPINFCSNEEFINLNEYVNYVDDGIFTLSSGGVVFNVPSTLASNSLIPTFATGDIDYKVNIDGCVVNASSTYQFKDPSTVAISTANASCGNNDGSASNFVTLNGATTYTGEWHTGESANIINNLPAGPVYFSATNNFGCTSVGFGNVELANWNYTQNVVNPSCFGSNNGSITVNATGISSPTFVWSNGYSTNTITNLSAGNYWVTITDPATNCIQTKFFTLTQPLEIENTFNQFEPDCGLTNGTITANPTGGSGTYSYLWTVDGQTTQQAVGLVYGLYPVVISDNSGCSQTFSFQLDEWQATTIAESVTGAHCNANDGSIETSFSNLNAGGLPTSVSWSNGVTTLPNIYNLPTNDYTITVTNFGTFNANVCHAQKVINVPKVGPSTQEICIVTVDTTTTTNLVVWEDLNAQNVSYYNIYRCNQVFGEFSIIDTVSFGSESVFEDVIANPMQRSWYYRIGAVDACNTEAPLSIPHKTVHLNTIENLGTGENIIHWDEYVGSINGANYIVWRYSDQNNWEQIGVPITFGTSTYSDVPPASLTNIDYYVSVQLSQPCLAQKARNFNSTRSNRDKGAFSVGEGTENYSNNGISEFLEQSNVYPNPLNGELLTIEISLSDVNYEIVNTQGAAISSGVLYNENTEISLKNISSGVYYLLLSKDGTRISKKIIKL